MLGCSTATKQVSDQNGCTIQIDPPEGKLPAKIEQATGTSLSVNRLKNQLIKLFRDNYRHHAGKSVDGPLQNLFHKLSICSSVNISSTPSIIGMEIWTVPSGRI